MDSQEEQEEFDMWGEESNQPSRDMKKQPKKAQDFGFESAAPASGFQ